MLTLAKNLADKIDVDSVPKDGEPAFPDDKWSPEKGFEAEGLTCMGTLAGFLQRAYVLSFYFLLQSAKHKNTSGKGYYHDCIRTTVREGGDTDTNAAIVGGMIGALVGLNKLTDVAKQRMVEYDTTVDIGNDNAKCKQLKDSTVVIGKDKDGKDIGNTVSANPRPVMLSVRHTGIPNIQKLIALAEKHIA